MYIYINEHHEHYTNYLIVVILHALLKYFISILFLNNYKHLDKYGSFINVFL